MRFLAFAFLFLFTTESSQAGNLKLGAMIGVNSAINQFDANSAIQTVDSKLGYNGNLFGRIVFTKFIIQPELGYLYNRVGISVLENSKIADVNFSLGQVYSSALFGFKLGNIRMAAGPMAILLADQSTEKLTATSTDIQQFTENSKNLSWGGVVNLGIDISKKWALDAKFSRSFSKSDFNAVINNNSNIFSGNTGMLSLSLGYSIFNLK